MCAGKVKKLCPWLAPLVNAVLDSSEFGSEKPALKEMSSSMPSCYAEASTSCDQFTLMIPYAESLIECCIMFAYPLPHVPPDFYFPNHKEFDFDYSECVLKNHHWDAKNEYCLRDQLLDIVSEFKIWQLSLGLEYPNIAAYLSELNDRYGSVDQSPDSNTMDVSTESPVLFGKGLTDVMDFIIFTEGPRAGEVSFVLDVCPMNWNDLDSIALPPGADTKANISLQITIKNYGSGRKSTKIFMDPFIQAFLEERKVLTFPSFTSGQSIPAYSDSCVDVIESAIKSKVESTSRKIELMFALATHFKNDIVEFDSNNYENICLLIERADFKFTLTIKLGSLLVERPRVDLEFSSVYHELDVEKKFTNRETLKLNPDTTPQDLVDLVLKFIDEFTVKFQKNSCTHGK